MAGTNFTDRFVYDGVARLVKSQQWVRRAPDAPAAIFADDFESGDISEWDIPQESFPADAYTEQLFGYDVPAWQPAFRPAGTITWKGICFRPRTGEALS